MKRFLFLFLIVISGLAMAHEKKNLSCVDLGSTSFFDENWRPASPVPYEFEGKFSIFLWEDRALEIISGLRKYAAPLQDDRPTHARSVLGRWDALLTEIEVRRTLFFETDGRRNKMIWREPPGTNGRHSYWLVGSINYFDDRSCGRIVQMRSKDALNKMVLWKLIWLDLRNLHQYEFSMNDTLDMKGQTSTDAFEVVRLAHLAAREIDELLDSPKAPSSESS